MDAKITHKKKKEKKIEISEKKEGKMFISCIISIHLAPVY